MGRAYTPARGRASARPLELHVVVARDPGAVERERWAGMDEDTVARGRSDDYFRRLDRLNEHGPADAIGWSLPEGMGA